MCLQGILGTFLATRHPVKLFDLIKVKNMTFEIFATNRAKQTPKVIIYFMDGPCVWPAVLVMWLLRSGSVGVGQLWGLESSSGLEGPGLERPVSSIGCCQLRWRPLGQRGKGWRVYSSGDNTWVGQWKCEKKAKIVKIACYEILISSTHSDLW